MITIRTLRALLVVGCALTIPAVAAELAVDLPVADGMVIQRGAPIPVRGTAAPGTTVELGLNGKVATAEADDDGHWQATLPAMQAGGPFEMSITAGDEQLVLSDLLVGDVWVCSGQSNMEWVVADSANSEQEIAAPADPMIRHFKVPRSWAEAPETTLAGGSWEPADPEHVGGFTAVGTFFARNLRKHVDVPIGLINSSWGGSRIEPWMSAAALGLDEAAVRKVLSDEMVFRNETLAAIKQRAGELPTEDAGLKDGQALWAAPELDDSAWDQIAVPARWEDEGYPGLDGIVWYRTSFELNVEEAAAPLQLGLGTIDDSDISWVNGHEVGRTEAAWNTPRVYELAPAVLREGANTIAVRVEDTGGGGGIWGDPELLFVDTGSRRIPLAGSWRLRIGEADVNLDFHKSQIPALVYNKMIHPLQAYPVTGVLWYQGESNAGWDDAVPYRKLFQDMIADWRRGWRQDDLPFLFVQLANYLSMGEEPEVSSWALLRESQSATLAVPNTAQAVIVDIGESLDIHPRNKQEVGRRLSLAARALVYGEDIVYSGPVYRDHVIEDGRFKLHFDHIGGGLVMRGGEDQASCFAVAGEDQVFRPANALIEGDLVVVWSEEIPQPMALRYAWSDDPLGAKLYNREGLPASPFRTDTW